MRAIGRAVIVSVPMCASRVLLEVVSTKGTYGMLVPMNNIPYLKAYLDNIPNPSLTTTPGKFPPMDLVTEQLDQVLFTIKTGRSEKFSVGIAHPFNTHREIWNAPNIQPTIVKSNQSTKMGIK